MEEIQIRLTKEFIAEVEDSEIDFDLQREFAGEVDSDTYVNIEWIEKGGPKWGSEGYPIRIDRVMQTLQEMKDKGATHVEMDEMEYHCDHISYPIYGYRITHADQADIDELEQKKTQAEKLAAEAKELRAKLREVEDQQRNLT